MVREGRAEEGDDVCSEPASSDDRRRVRRRLIETPTPRPSKTPTPMLPSSRRLLLPARRRGGEGREPRMRAGLTKKEHACVVALPVSVS